MSSTSLEYLDLHPFVRSTVIDKARGVIFGGALGDAVGLYTEFFPKEQAQKLYRSCCISFLDPKTPLHGDNHRDRFRAGAWTDDTDHAVMLLLSYLHTDGKLDVLDFARRLRSWGSGQGLRCLDRLPLGVGKTVSQVLGSPGYETNPTKASEDIWRKSGCNIAANGSLMRTNILGIICIKETLEDTWKIAMEVSLITHYDPRCVVSCCAVTALIRGILRYEVTNEEEMDSVLDGAWKFVCSQKETLWPDTQLDEAEYRKHTRAETLEDLQLDDARKMGYVYKGLGCSILLLRLALRAPENASRDIFGESIMNLMLEGGDADTNACIAGGLLGALVGYRGLTPRWRDGLVHQEWLMTKSDHLIQTVGIMAGNYRGSEDPSTSFDGGKGLLSREEMDEREKALVTMMLHRMMERKEKMEAEERGKRGIWARLKG